MICCFRRACPPARTSCFWKLVSLIQRLTHPSSEKNNKNKSARNVRFTTRREQCLSDGKHSGFSKAAGPKSWLFLRPGREKDYFQKRRKMPPFPGIPARRYNGMIRIFLFRCLLRGFICSFKRCDTSSYVTGASSKHYWTNFWVTTCEGRFPSTIVYEALEAFLRSGSWSILAVTKAQ